MATEKIPAGSETTPAPSELQPLTPTEQALLDILTLPEELQAPLRSEFEMTKNMLLAGQPSDDQRLAVTAVADKIGWELFGKPGEELPATLALEVGYGEPHIEYAPSTPFRLDELELELRNSLFNPFLEVREKYLVRKFERLNACIVADIHESGDYAFFKSFDTENSVFEKNMPLTPFERQVREAQLTDDIKRRFGIAATQHILRHSDADTTLRRGIRALDDETMPAPNTTQKSAFDRFNAYMLPIAQAWVDKDPVYYPTGIVRSIFIDKEGVISLETENGVQVCLDDVYTWAEELCDAVGGNSYYQWLGVNFLGTIYRGEGIDFKSALETSVGLLTDNSVDEMMNYADEMMLQLTRLRRPRGLIYNWIDDAGKRSTELTHETQSASIVDGTNLEQEMHTTVGWVERRTEYDTARLIIGTEADKRTLDNTVRNLDGYCDMAISFTHETMYRGTNALNGQYYTVTRPIVPGYITHESAPDYYEFTRGAHDPYIASYNILIDGEGCQRLAAAYTGLGFTELATEITRQDTLTVHDLADIIRRSSDYTFDQSIDSLDHTEVRDIKNFKRLVRDGRLQLQCTGAAAFLGRSLELALPGCASATISGHVLGNSSRIDGVKHAQTQSIYNGIVFIADATPGLSAAALPCEGDAPWIVRDKLYEPNNVSTSSQPLPDLTKGLPTSPEPLDIEPFATPQLSPDQRRKRVEQMLRVLFDSSNNEALYRSVAKLPSEDPVRRTLQAVMTESTDNEALSNFLRHYADANEATLRRARLRRYDPHLLRTLATVFNLP